MNLTPFTKNLIAPFRKVFWPTALAVIMFAALTAQAQQAAADSLVPVNAEAITYLYGATAVRTEGKAASLDHLPKTMVIRWAGRGSATWQINVAQAGDYEVALCYAALTSGPKLEVRSATRKVTLDIHPTDGPYYPRLASKEGPLETGFLRNFERVHLDGALHLSAGKSEITIAVTHPESNEVMDFRAMELTPISAKKEIAASLARAHRQRGSTDWMAKAKYGVMFHWADTSAPPQGPCKPYAQAVGDFDVNAFANMVEETGAGYVVFTLCLGHPHCPAPIKSWEKAHPGWTTQRDLVGDMADALNKKGIKLITYISSHIIIEGENIPLERAIDVHMEILRELGDRYGKKLAGYWFDGWDIIPQTFPRAAVSYEEFFKATKAGNPNRIIGLNFWIFPDATPWQEFWAGEADEQLKPTKNRYMRYDAGKGLQRHALFMLEGIWAHRKLDAPMEKPQFTEKQLIDYVKQLTANQGVATINLGIFQDGTIGPESRKVMQALRQAIRK